MPDFIVVLGFLWLAVLTVLWAWVFLFFRGLSKEVKNGSFLELLKNIVDKDKRRDNDLKEFSKKLGSLEEDVKGHVQKIGIVRFNPFRGGGR